MRALIPFAIAVTVLVGGCGDTGDKTSDRPGNPAVYDRIDAMSSCDDLQHEFDVAMANHDRAPSGSDKRSTSLAYAQAAQARMEAVKCP